MPSLTRAHSHWPPLSLLLALPPCPQRVRLCLCQVYPNGTRLMSSNYDPFPLWAAGVRTRPEARSQSPL
eukprot:6208499-Pleurochrysis_carterae.AAC.3